MSLEATRWAWAQQLSPTCKLVLLSLADRADDKNECFPSVSKIAKDTGLYRETIMEKVKEIEAIGLLKVERRNGAGNVYQLQTSREKPTGSEKPTSREKPQHQSGKADSHQSGKADTNLPIEPINNLKQKTRSKVAADLFDPLAIELPACIDHDLWANWIAYRREMKFTVKERATRAQVAFLQQMNTKGHNPKEIVLNSVRNGWQGLFEPKKTNSTYHDSIVACGKAIFGDLSNGPIDITPTSREVDSEDFFRITG